MSSTRLSIHPGNYAKLERGSSPCKVYSLLGDNALVPRRVPDWLSPVPSYAQCLENVRRAGVAESLIAPKVASGPSPASEASRTINAHGTPPPMPSVSSYDPRGDGLPDVFSDTEHTFEGIGFTLMRCLMRDVRGPLSSYVISNFVGDGITPYCCEGPNVNAPGREGGEEGSSAPAGKVQDCRPKPASTRADRSESLPVRPSL